MHLKGKIFLCMISLYSLIIIILKSIDPINNLLYSKNEETKKRIQS